MLNKSYLLAAETDCYASAALVHLYNAHLAVCILCCWYASVICAWMGMLGGMIRADGG